MVLTAMDSIGSESYSLESSFDDRIEVLKSCPIKDHIAALHESFTEVTYDTTSRDETVQDNDDDEGSYAWDQLFPGEEKDKQQQEEEEGEVPFDSCENLGWQERSQMSAFSLYLDIEASSDVSVLDPGSMEHDSEYTEESVSMATTLESQNVFSGAEYNESSMNKNKIIQTDEDSSIQESAYEVKSATTNESGCDKVDHRWDCERVHHRLSMPSRRNSLQYVDDFRARAQRRLEKRSRIRDSMFELGSSLSKLEYQQERTSALACTLANEIQELMEDSSQLDNEVEPTKTEIDDTRVDNRFTLDFDERARKRNEKRSRIMTKMNGLDVLMKCGSDDFAERARRRKEKRSRIMDRMYELNSSLSKLEY